MEEIRSRKLSEEERLQIYNKCNRRCAYCGCNIEYKDMQVNHAEPLWCGGADELNNMLPACRTCNYYKTPINVENFRNYINGIPERLTRDSVPFAIGKRFGVVQEHNEPIVFYFERMKEDKKRTNFDICYQSIENMAQVIDIMKRGWTKEQVVEWLQSEATEEKL